MKVWHAATVLVGALGCGIGFTEPPAAEKDARLFINVTLDDSVPSAEARVMAFLEPGVGPDAVRRAVPDPTLRVLGLELTPEILREGEVYGYSARWTFDGDQFAGALVEPEAPAIENLAPPPVVRGVAPWRSGSRIVELARGSDLRFDTARPAVPPDPAAFDERWSLFLRRDGRPVAQLSADGPVPSPLVIPGAWLSGVTPGELETELRVLQSVRGTSSDGGYAVLVSLSVVLRWTVVLFEP